MNNRYICRGKRKDNGEWVEGYLYITHNGEYEIKKYDEVSNIEGMTYEVTPETVGQLTGLEDKNGKPIYDGDVVKAYDETYDNGLAEVKGKVFFNCGSFDIDDEDVGYIPLYSYGTENVEVIGNIHDNRELLEVER